MLARASAAAPEPIRPLVQHPSSRAAVASGSPVTSPRARAPVRLVAASLARQHGLEDRQHTLRAAPRGSCQRAHGLRHAPGLTVLGSCLQDLQCRWLHAGRSFHRIEPQTIVAVAHGLAKDAGQAGTRGQAQRDLALVESALQEEGRQLLVEISEAVSHRGSGLGISNERLGGRTRTVRSGSSSRLMRGPSTISWTRPANAPSGAAAAARTVCSSEKSARWPCARRPWDHPRSDCQAGSRFGSHFAVGIARGHAQVGRRRRRNS